MLKDSQSAVRCKATEKKIYRPLSATQHALFLQYVSLSSTDLFSFDQTLGTQATFDHFYYDIAISLLNAFYPERTISVTSRDPHSITPAINGFIAKVRRKKPIDALW